MPGFFQMLKELKSGNNASSSTSTSTFYVDNTNPPHTEEEEEEQINNYEEPFDTKKDHDSQQSGQRSSIAGSSSRHSNESFSEIFARHLKNRVSDTKVRNTRLLLHFSININNICHKEDNPWNNLLISVACL
jgi:hypothetical protein